MSNSCVICTDGFEGSSHVIVGPSGFATIKRFAIMRKKEDVVQRMTDARKKYGEVLVHAACRKSFTDSRKLQQLREDSRPALRSSQQPFAFEDHCFLCGERFPSASEIERHPERYSVLSIRTMGAEAAIKAAIESRAEDEWSKQVKIRAESVLNLIAADARYHLQCYKNFVHPRHLSTPAASPAAMARGRVPDPTKVKGFELLCQFLEENEECQFAATELVAKLQVVTVGEAYSEKTLFRRLQEKYGDNIVIAGQPGGKTTVCFKGVVTRLLTDKWYADKKKDPCAERLRVVKAAAAVVRQDIRGCVFDTQVYPDVEQIRQGGSDTLPETIRLLITDIVGGKGKAASRRAEYLQQCLVSAARRRSYISPLKHGLAVTLHTRYGSRDLLRLLSSVGAVADYAETTAFEKSAALACASSHVEPTAFEQYIGDNFDQDVRTVDGHNTLHILGMVKVVTPSTAVTHPASVPRGKASGAAGSVAHLAKVPIIIYPPPVTPGLQTIRVQELDLAADDEAKKFRLLNTLWLAYTGAAPENSVGWNGFMSAAFQTAENYSKSVVLPLPFIHLEPSNPSAIFSCLLHTASESAKLLQDHCLVTFDFPLYIKAVDILFSEPRHAALRATILRLGGFHLLMSFLGAIGFLMACSGLEELWQTVYAKNSIRHLMSGHSYSRAVRAHLLTFASLATLLLTGSEEADEEAIESIVEQILTGEVSHSEAAQSTLAQRFLDQLDAAIADAEKQGPTQKLWVQYFKCVEIVTLFIAAERSGNFKLHLHCIEKMLPFFYASGHLNYAKGAQLYLQQMQDLERVMAPQEYEKFTTQGFFTVRRTTKFWSGTWSDMIIEQALMRQLKSGGGLTRGRGFTDEVVARWIHALPETARVIEAVEDFCGISTVSSEQHVELRDARRRRDTQDIEKFVLWLKMHNPFDKLPTELVSLSSGFVGNATVNCHMAEEVGRQAMLKSLGQDFKTLKLHRKDACKTLASLNRAVVRVGGEEIEINPNQLFHRSLCVLKTAEEVEMMFAFEMAARAPALFESSGCMRTACKSSLAEVFIQEYNAFDSVPTPQPTSPRYVIDGGYLLHKVVFPRPATFSAIADVYCDFVLRHWGVGSTVVFDGYPDHPTTKSETQHRRAAKLACIDMQVELDVTCSFPQPKFLSNSRNKTQFISLLSQKLQQCGVVTIQAESDADTVIVQAAVTAARCSSDSSVILVGEDTDLLVLLLHHTQEDDVYMLMPGRTKSADVLLSVKKMQLALKGLHKYLLFLHAFSGCDTTSAFYRKGKKTAWNCLKKFDEDFLNLIDSFYADTVSVDALVSVGETCVRRLYGFKDDTPITKVRHQLYQRTVAKQPLTSNFELAVLPPTSGSILQQCLRVHHQVQQWLGRDLEPTLWGWKLDGRVLRPIPMLDPPAPEHLLVLVYCSCRGTCSTRCQCRRAGIPCTDMCRFCAGHSCTNRTVQDGEEEEEAEADVDDPAAT